MKDTHMVFIGRGIAGWLGGTVLPDGTTGASVGGDLDGYVAQSPDGTPVYDSEATSVEDLYDFILDGPTMDGHLRPWEIVGDDDDSPFQPNLWEMDDSDLRQFNTLDRVG